MAVINHAHNISSSIDRPFHDVYDFISRPDHFPRWATGLATAREVYVPMRVVANGSGSEATFTCSAARR